MMCPALSSTCHLNTWGRYCCSSSFWNEETEALGEGLLKATQPASTGGGRCYWVGSGDLRSWVVYLQQPFPFVCGLTGDAGTRRSYSVTVEHVALPQTPAARLAPHPGSAVKLTCCACRYARWERDQGSFWLMIVHLLHSTSLICSFFRRYLMAVTDILHGSVAFTAWKCTVSFCFNLTGNSGLVGPSTDWKHLFEGLDFFKKPQMNIHLWIQLLLWLLFFKLLAS